VEGVAVKSSCYRFNSVHKTVCNVRHNMTSYIHYKPGCHIVPHTAASDVVHAVWR